MDCCDDSSIRKLNTMGAINFNFGNALTITTTANQNAFLGSLLVRENAVRIARTPPDPVLTMEQFLRDIFVATLQGYRDQAGVLDRADARTVFQGLSGTQKAQIVALLGGNDPFQ
jgi:hypothetical protein